MDRLLFGTTARKRARRRRRFRRLSLVAWVASSVALAGGPLYSLNHTSVARMVGLGGDPSPAPSISAASSDIAIDSTRSMVDEGGKNHPAAGEAEGGSVAQIIRAAAAKYGVSGDYLVSIAACESGLNPRAYNSAGYHGLFQYDTQTWGTYGKGSIWDPAAQAEATARLIANGESSRWPNCG